MSQWMTSGASRLRAKQKRSFASRAQLRTVAARLSTTRSTAGIPGQRQATSRRRIKVGETVSSSSKPMYRTGEIAQVNVHSQLMSVANGGHPAFNDVDGHRCRVRDPSSSVRLLSRQILDKARQDLGLLSSSNSRSMSLHSLAPRTSSGNPFDAALQAIDDVLMRPDMTPSSQRPQANEQYQIDSPPRYEHSSPFTQTSQNQPSLFVARLAADQSATCASPSSTFQCNEQTTSWDAWNPGLLQRQFKRRQGLRLPSRSESSVTEADGFVLRSPQTVQSAFAVQHRLNLMNHFRRAAGNMPRPDSSAFGNLSRPDSCPFRPLKRESEYSSDSSVSSTGSRKQPRLDGFGLNNDRYPEFVSGSFLLAGEQKRVGGIGRFKTRRVGDTAYPHDVAGQKSSATTLPSQRKSSSIIDVGHLDPRLPPVWSLEQRNRQAPALRFFNNGIEVDIRGQPIVDTKLSSETKGEQLCENGDKPLSCLYRRIDKKAASARCKVIQETDVLTYLEERQQSIWAQLTVDAEEAKAERNSKARARTSPEEAATALLQS